MSKGHAVCTAVENDTLPGYSSVQRPCCHTPVHEAVLGRERGQPVAGLMESFWGSGSPPGFGMPGTRRNNRKKSL